MKYNKKRILILILILLGSYSIASAFSWVDGPTNQDLPPTAEIQSGQATKAVHMQSYKNALLDLNDRFQKNGNNLFYNSGNVGIGTNNPANPLTVAGAIQSTSGGFIFPDGTTQTTAASGSSGGGSSLWTSGTGTDIYRGSGNVGIGTVSPSYVLDVRTNNDSPLLNLSSNLSAELTFSPQNNVNYQYEIAVSSGNLNINNNGVSRIYIQDNAFVGIGTTAPQRRLHVNGSIMTNNELCIGNSCRDNWGINGITDAQKDTINNNLFLGHGGFSGTFYNNDNTAIGIEALDNFNSNGSQSYYGDKNVAVGNFSLTNNTTGNNNSALGFSSLNANLEGSYNSAHGSNSLFSNINGSFNTAQGNYSLYSNDYGAFNTAQGSDSLRSNTSGDNNTAQGESALRNNTIGASNTAQGKSALNLNIDGNNNTAQGNRSLLYNVSGNNNSAQGSFSLASNSSGSNNTAQGVNAGRYITNGSTGNSITNNSVFLGANTKAQANGQTNQIVIGYDAIGNGSDSVTLGNDNITKTILKGNVSIGTTSSNHDLTVIGNTLLSNGTGDSWFPFTNGWSYVSGTGVIFRTGNTERARLHSNGNFGIGTVNPNYKLDVQNGRFRLLNMLFGGSSRFYIAPYDDGAWQWGREFGYDNVNNRWYVDTDLFIAGTAFAASHANNSDRNLKKNIKILNNYKDILNIDGKKFNWKNNNKLDIGIIAQDVQKYFPEIVSLSGKYLTVDYGKLIAPLINLSKEQEERLNKQEKEIKKLKQEIAELKEMIKNK